MSQKNIADIYPLSPLQEGLLFHSLEPQSGLYMSQVACRLDGLEPEGFLRAWAEVVNRHPSLRSAVVWKRTERPLQVVARKVGVPCERGDWRDAGPEEQEQRLEEFLAADRERGFQLSRAPLLRLALFQLGEKAYQLVWSYHHLIFDGWCRALILREILQVYEAEKAGRSMALPPARPYRDYIAWLDRRSPSSTEDFWRQKLEAFEPSNLPADHSGPAGTPEAEELQLDLSAATTAGLLDFARRHRLTPNTLALGLYAVLRGRYCGQSRVLFGAIFSGRPADLRGSEEIVGMFANALPVPVQVEERGVLIPWFQRLQEDLMTLRQHEHTPLARIQRWVADGGSLFEDLFAYQNYPREDSVAGSASGLALSEARAVERGNYPLYFIVEPGESWRLEAIYDRRRFSPTRIRRLLEHYRRLLEALPTNFERPFLEWDLLRPSERAQVLVEWNATPGPQGERLGTLERIHRVMEQAPDRPAVLAPGQVLSFGELGARARWLARHLRSQGLGPEGVAAVLCSRSPALSIAVLGILEAGGAFLPLDPDQPAERLEFMLRDCATQVLVTEGELASGLAEGVSRVVLHEGEVGPVEPEAGSLPDPVSDPEHLAYVFYTSGSTGRPKGVGVPHHALDWYVRAVGGEFALNAGDRMLQFASPGFDVLIEELFPIWCGGGALVMERPETLASPAALAVGLERNRVTAVELPAVYWHEWVELLSITGGTPPACLRLLLLGSEKPLPERLTTWAQFNISTIFVFGLTETAVTSAFFRVPQVPDPDREPPIGRPPVDARLFVLDPEGRPVPPGVSGELYIGGGGLARGYRGRASLTAARFVPNPWGKSGERLYRTGDRVAYRTGGELDFFGRLDAQLKVRGVRIEPGEVEAVLREHPGVREAVVMARQEGPGEKRLVAYAVPSVPGAEGPIAGSEAELWPATGEYHLYDEVLYHLMTSDEVRNRSYRVAMERHVEGKVVVDLGTGREATLARMCVEAGARKVYAVEMMPEAFREAREHVGALGLEDVIEVIQGDALSVELPEVADVCVSELLGTIGSGEGAVPILNQAWRLLRPGGVMIPGRCATRIAAVRLPTELAEGPCFRPAVAPYVERLFAEAGRRFDFRLCIQNFPQDHVVSTSDVFEDLHFTGPVDLDLRREIRLEILEDTRLHGLLLWLNLYTTLGEHLDVLQQPCCWPPAFFPVWSEGIEVSRGDVIRAECRVEHPEPRPGATLPPVDYHLEGRLERRNGTVLEFTYRAPHDEMRWKSNPFHRTLFDGEQPVVRERPFEGVSVGQLQAFLRDRLPVAMVPSALVLLDRVPLTPHGKIDRRALPAPGLGGSTRALPVAPSNEREATLVSIWQEVLGVAEIGVEDSFFELGGDSILSIRIASRAQRQGLDITPGQVFESHTIRRLAGEMEPEQPSAPTPPSVCDEARLTPMQHWFFEGPKAAAYWNMPILLRLRGDLRREVAEAALGAVLAHHQGLRLAFDQADGKWQPRIAPEAKVSPLPMLDLSRLPEPLALRCLAEAAEVAQASLDLASAPLLRTLWFVLPGGQVRWLLAVHHLVIDAVSWQVVVEDLEQACGRLERGERPSLTPATGIGAWSTRLEELGHKSAFEKEIDFWRGVVEKKAASLPLDHAPEGTEGKDSIAWATNLEGTVEEIDAELSVEETEALLRRAGAAYKTRVEEVLLTALARSLGTVANVSSGAEGDSVGLRIELEGHGREAVVGLEGSRTVGWLSTLFPVWLPLEEGLMESLVAVKERMRSIPHRGLGYGVLRASGSEGTRELRERAGAEVVFNYLGRVDRPQAGSALFELASEDIGPAIGPAVVRRHLLEVNARVAEGRLRARFRFSRALHRPETVETWAAAFVQELKRLVEHCTTPGVGCPTPSDFPLAQVQFPELRQLAETVGDMETLLRLSPLQQGMLFHSLYEPGDGVYVAQIQVALRGTLHSQALRKAWREVVQRHPVLRTSFFWREVDQPAQLVSRQVAVPWREEDWRGVPSPEQERRLEAFLGEDRRRGFDPSQAPLLRLTLVRTGEERHLLVVSLHQMMMDGWSLPLLLEDVFALYGAEITGGAPQLPARRPFEDYVAWLVEQDPGESERWWRETLAGYREPARLALAPNPSGTGAYGKVERSFSPEQTATLSTLARTHGLTPNTLVQGILALLLGRYSDREDVVFGVTVSGRPADLRGVESMLGLFINTLPLRAKPTVSTALWSWLKSLQQDQLTLRRHGHTALAEVQRWSDLPAGQALFETLFVFQNYPAMAEQGPGLGGLAVEAIETAEQTNYPLTLMAHPGETLGLSLAFQDTLFDALGASRLLAHLSHLLLSIPNRDDVVLGDLSLLSPAEQHQLRCAWNDTARTWPGDELVHTLVATQARRIPEAVAVTFENESLSHGELLARARGLASHLVKLGVGPETPVAVFAERSLELVVALLGILEAGGAFVPLDPEFPARRLQKMVERAGCPVILYRGACPPGEWGRDLRWVCLDDLPEVEEEVVLPAVDPRHAAYVIFTSGSSGIPKATITCHGAICNRLRWLEDYAPLVPGDSVLQKTPLTFDVSVWELFWPLLAGARLVEARPGGHRDGTYLGERIPEERITVTHFVPSMLELFLHEPGVDSCHSLRRVICSGEALTPALVRRLVDRLPRAELLNLYGPTEAAVEVSYRECRGDEDPVPIGRPIANARLDVLDRRLRRIPSGVEGELFIGGTPPARGYLGQPGRTAESFVPDPYGGQPGARLYRTGDRARQRRDGAIEYLGRIDFQVKIRGVRIELGEIETALNEHPGVRQAAATLYRPESGRPRILAHIVPAEGEAPGEQELRTFLRERLPEAMVPGAFSFLEALPLGTSGKLDRAALPEPDFAAPEAAPESAHEAGESPAEEELASIWREVLNLDQVSGDANFLELGGDSILAMLVASKAARLGLRLGPREVLQSESLRELAQAMEERIRTDAEQGAVSGPVPLTPVQGWFFEWDREDPHFFNQTLLLEVLRELSPALFDRTLEALLAHHDALRLRFHRGDEGWSQENAPAESSRVGTTIDLRHLREGERLPLLRDLAQTLQASLDLSAGPLLRVALFRCGALGDFLLLSAHHLVVDGVSWQVLLEDLDAVYGQLEAGQPIRLPRKTTSYKGWAENLVSHAESELARRELAYWIAEPRSTVRALPVDRPEGRNTVGSFHSFTLSLTPEETRTLFDEALGFYRLEARELLLATLGRTLASWIGGGTFLVDVEGHGREELFEGVDLSRTVGWFTSIYPVRIELGTPGDIGHDLRTVKEQLRGIPRGGIDYGVLRYLTPEGQPLAELPQAEILFNFFGQVEVDRALGSSLLAWSRQPLGSATSGRSLRRHRLKVDGQVVGGRLEVEWGYSRNLFHGGTVERIGEAYFAQLRQAIAGCGAASSETFAPSDFNLVSLKQKQIDRLARKYGQES